MQPQTNKPLPRPDPESIYPTIADRPGSKSSGVTPSLPKVQKSSDRNFWHGFFQDLVMFLAGLLLMGIVGLILGAVFNELLASHSHEYFGTLGDAIDFIYVLPIVTLFFIIAAISAHNWWLVFYPFIAFGLAQDYVHAYVTKLLAGYIPALPVDGHPQYFEYMIAVTLSYISVHAVAGPLRKIYKNREAILSKQQTPIVLTNVIFLALVGAFVGVVSIASKPLYASQQRARTAVHIPNTDKFFGETRDDFELHYAEPTKQYDGTYQETDEVLTGAVQKWWSKDAHEVCGDQYSTTIHPGQVVKNEYKKTSSDITYATAVFDANSSQPAVPSSAYKEYRYCFVVGYQRYDLIRSDSRGAAYLEKYPAETVIDAIASAKPYVPACSDDKKKPFYCTANDNTQNKLLSEELPQRYKQFDTSKAGVLPGIKTPTTNPKAYKSVDQLTVAEWGISFPLSEEIKDAYYVKTTDNSVTVGLRAYDNDSCFAGKRTTRDRDLIGDGVAYLTRTKVSDPRNTQSNTYISGIVVGDYVYGLYANANLSFCARSLGKDDAFKDKLRDVFDWAAVNIK
jgi:hypothetical protein